MNLSDRDIERLLRDSVDPRGDVKPPPRLRTRVMHDARPARKSAGAAFLRLLLPYAAGVLTVLAVERGFADRGAPESPARASYQALFGPIADRVQPSPSALAPSDDAPPAPEPVSEPVPRIS